jgi:hypothetical protein
LAYEKRFFAWQAGVQTVSEHSEQGTTERCLHVYTPIQLVIQLEQTVGPCPWSGDVLAGSSVRGRQCVDHLAPCITCWGPVQLSTGRWLATRVVFARVASRSGCWTDNNIASDAQIRTSPLLVCSTLIKL